jgi:hypothetical protein
VVKSEGQRERGSGLEGQRRAIAAACRRGLAGVQLPAFVGRAAQAPTARRPAQQLPADTPPQAPRGALAEAFYDPLGSWDNGRFGGPIGHHSDHVHLSITNPRTMLAAIRQAQSMGLHVGENPYLDHVGVHAHGSFHYQNFPGKYGGKSLGKKRSTCPATRKRWPPSTAGRPATCDEGQPQHGQLVRAVSPLPQSLGGQRPDVPALAG